MTEYSFSIFVLDIASFREFQTYLCFVHSRAGTKGIGPNLIVGRKSIINENEGGSLEPQKSHNTEFKTECRKARCVDIS